MLNQLSPVDTHSGRKNSVLNVKISRYSPRRRTAIGHLTFVLNDNEKNCNDSTIFFKLFVACDPIICDALYPKNAKIVTTTAAAKTWAGEVAGQTSHNCPTL